MPKISAYPDGGEFQTGDQIVVARAGSNKSILGGKIANRTAFTPTIVGDGVAGAGTYTQQLGHYSRIGNLCFFKIGLVWTAHTGSGNMFVAGLPIVAVNDSYNTPITVYWNNITLLAVGNKIEGLVNFGQTTISLYEIGSGANSLLPLDTNATLRLSGIYYIA